MTSVRLALAGAATAALAPVHAASTAWPSQSARPTRSHPQLTVILIPKVAIPPST